MSNTTHICTSCKQPVFLKDETFVLLSGGGLVEQAIEKKPKSLTAFVDISWRSPYSKGEGGTLKYVHLVECSEDQFEFMFCSSACLKTYLNSRVDALDSEINSWYRERISWVLEESGRSAAIDEWCRYFGCSTSEAEEALNEL